MSDANIYIKIEEAKVFVEEHKKTDIVLEIGDVYGIGVKAPDIFTPTNGQTVFTLSVILVGIGILAARVFLNGQKLPTLPIGTYTISGSQLTIILPYSLDNNDIIEVYY